MNLFDVLMGAWTLACVFGFGVWYGDMVGCHPFSAVGRAAWKYRREVNRRATRLMALGVDPDDARKAACAEMRSEANETLKAEGAIKELLR